MKLRAEAQMKILKKIIFPILLILCLASGTIWQSAMTQIEKSKYCAIGDYVDVGTYQAHYYLKGSGDTAFVFISGSGTPCAYTDFYALQNMLSAKGQMLHLTMQEADGVQAQILYEQSKT